MTERDLTKQYIAFRNGFRARRGPKLMNKYNFQANSSQYHDIERQSLMNPISSNSNLSPTKTRQENTPKYLQKLHKTQNLIKLIENDLDLLRNKHKKRLLISFDNSEEIKEKEINSITLRITNQFYEIKKILEASNHQESINSNNKMEIIIENNLNKNLAKKIQKLNINFRKLQKNYIMKLKQQKTHTDQDILGLGFDSVAGNSSTTKGGSGGGMQVMEYETKLDEKRNEEIQQISKNIQELANIFQDLSILVIDQGTILDRIDYNLENIEIKVEKGVDELIIADQYSQSSRPFKCIMILLGIIIFEALVLLVQN